MNTYHVIPPTEARNWAVEESSPQGARRVVAECPTREDAETVAAVLKDRETLRKMYLDLKGILTPRDHFAMHAAEGCVELILGDRLIGRFGNDPATIAPKIASAAYQVADAMMKQREVP